MKESIEKAIYYSATNPNQYCEPLITLEYNNKEELYNILNNLNESIDLITFFAPKKDKCYSAFPYLYYCYENLLLDKISVLYLVNRNDFCIKFVKKDMNTNENMRYAILKTDSIFSELNSNSKSSWWYLIYPGLFLLGAGAVWLNIETDY